MAIFHSTCVGGALCQAHGHGAPRKKGCPIGSGSDPTRDLAAYGKNRTQVSEFLVSGTQACKARLHSVSATSLPQVTGNPTEGRAGSYHTHPLAACCQKSRPSSAEPTSGTRRRQWAGSSGSLLGLSQTSVGPAGLGTEVAGSGCPPVCIWSSQLLRWRSMGGGWGYSFRPRLVLRRQGLFYCLCCPLVDVWRHTELCVCPICMDCQRSPTRKGDYWIFERLTRETGSQAFRFRSA